MSVINVTDEQKEYIEGLRVKWVSRSGRNITMKEIVEKLMQFIREREKEFLETF